MLCTLDERFDFAPILDDSCQLGCCVLIWAVILILPPSLLSLPPRSGCVDGMPFSASMGVLEAVRVELAAFAHDDAS